jgi:hypothetical protein
MKKSDGYFLLGVFVFLLIGLLVLKTLNSEGAKCMANPLEYGVKVNSESVGSELNCYCFFNSSRLLPFGISLNGTIPIVPKWTTDVINTPSINFTNLIPSDISIG